MTLILCNYERRPLVADPGITPPDTGGRIIIIIIIWTSSHDLMMVLMFGSAGFWWNRFGPAGSSPVGRRLQSAEHPGGGAAPEPRHGRGGPEPSGPEPEGGPWERQRRLRQRGGALHGVAL